MLKTYLITEIAPSATCETISELPSNISTMVVNRDKLAKRESVRKRKRVEKRCKKTERKR